MSLKPGMRFGPYEILSLVGAGGMGAVYKARDTRLDRTVAIKVLPEDVASDPERRHRFEREARTVSQLNHPHIATLFDLGQNDGIHFFIMEYVEGETLFDRLKKGPLPLAEALRYGAEIADALDKAHRQGVVHRDVKPGNIMLTKSGTKLLDFGLAKARTSPIERDNGLSSAPTEAKPLTDKGAFMGTLQYMAPEQLEGKEVDARADLFSLGAVLYEMASGKRAFEGASPASLIAAILEHQPASLVTFSAGTPAALDHVTSRCLAKDPDSRWQSASDLALELQWIMEGGRAVATTGRPSERPGRERLAWLAFGATALAAVVLLLWNEREPSLTTKGTTRLVIDLAPGEQLPRWASISCPIALSPDGSRLVYVVARGNGKELHVRELNQFESRPVPGSEGTEAPVFSPDGEWLAFFAKGQLYKVFLAGGGPQAIGRAPLPPYGVSWGEDGTILFGTPVGLWQVSSRGGMPELFVKLSGDINSYRYPQSLAGGAEILFTENVEGGWNVLALNRETGKERTLPSTESRAFTEIRGTFPISRSHRRALSRTCSAESRAVSSGSIATDAQGRFPSLLRIIKGEVIVDAFLHLGHPVILRENLHA